jgi:hypothetical protein
MDGLRDDDALMDCASFRAPSQLVDKSAVVGDLMVEKAGEEKIGEPDADEEGEANGSATGDWKGESRR